MQKILWLASALLVAALLAIFLFPQGGQGNKDAPAQATPKDADARQKTQSPASTHECAGNATMPCALGGCGGAKYCIGGRWGACVRNMPVCSPGSHVPCFMNACSIGERECNACADGWGECAPRKA